MLQLDGNVLRKTLPNIKSGICRYVDIMNTFSICDVSKSSTFQRTYDGFYRVRRNPQFRECYFQYMEINRNTVLDFQTVVTHFYKLFHSVEASFSSKLLATLDPSKPIWDQYVLHNLGLTKPLYQNPKRLQATIELYQYLIDWYSEYLTTQNAQDALRVFDQMYPNLKLSKLKKIDFCLWSIR